MTLDCPFAVRRGACTTGSTCCAGMNTSHQTELEMAEVLKLGKSLKGIPPSETFDWFNSRLPDIFKLTHGQNRDQSEICAEMI